MCDPKRMGLSDALDPARRPMMLPATSTEVSRPASRINPITYARPCLSNSLYATRLTPPYGFFPNSDNATRCWLIRSPLTRSAAVFWGPGSELRSVAAPTRVLPSESAPTAPARRSEKSRRFMGALVGGFGENEISPDTRARATRYGEVQEY